MSEIDTGDVAEVPADERLDVDEGEGANAMGDGGDDADGLDAIYDDPGEVVEEDLGA